MQGVHRINTCGLNKCHHRSSGFLFAIAIAVVVVGVATMDCHCHKVVAPVDVVVVGLALLYTFDYYLMAAPTPEVYEVVVAMVME
jgi:hypothetical protein